MQAVLAEWQEGILPVKLLYQQLSVETYGGPSQTWNNIWKGSRDVRKTEIWFGFGF